VPTDDLDARARAGDASGELSLDLID